VRARGTSVTILLQVKLYKDASRAGMRHHEVSSRHLVRPHCCTQTSETFSHLTGRRDSKLPRGHLGLHRTTCQACRVIGMKFVAVRICEASCHCVSDPYIERASSTGIWLQWPHWDVMLLTLPSSAKRGAQMLQLDSLSKQHIRCCGNFTASHWLCMLTCYLMVCPSLLRRISASNAHYATALVTMQ
jgi:hypothetical protein